MHVEMWECRSATGRDDPENVVIPKIYKSAAALRMIVIPRERWFLPTIPPVIRNAE